MLSTTMPTRWLATGLATATLAVGGVATSTSAQAAGGDVWDRVAACESGGNWNINTGNGFSGGLQFTASTWRAYGGTGSAQNASKAEQIAVAKRVLAGQGPGAWPVCSRKAGLTRGNGGASAGTADGSRSSRSTERRVVEHAPRATKAHKASKHVVEVRATKATRPAAPARRATASNLAFPGRDAFVLGHRDPAVTLLGKQLVKRGFGSHYKVGPGPVFTEADRAAVADFQRALGWTGSDANGYPGPRTWALLFSAR
ncbi:peptidoglycan-binding protein [Arsenicicoccus dermatophilus]|uniref:peptidoglycan-binding protein n=1 Tax=Arsenicicoccus dermatophilus TaxID=1076331 RepID=UPI0024092E26|nr:peptidoglycan-binding protein [Arsenicicoccus dermatophilus]